MLEYVYFDFSPFGLSNEKVSSFKNLLASIHSFCEFKKFEILPPWIARDATFAVQYLHQNGTAHRDLKTFNVLASNQHFCDLSDEEEIASPWQESPVSCKIIDFGLSRSETIQSHTILQSWTANMKKDTLAFLAAELVLENIFKQANQEDFYKSDMWSLCLLYFSFFNPDLLHPYEVDLQAKRNIRWQEAMREITLQGKLPTPNSQYRKYQKTHWKVLEVVMHICLRSNSFQHPELSSVSLLTIFAKSLCSNIHLTVSQDSVLESYKKKIAPGLMDSVIAPLPANDALYIADALLRILEFNKNGDITKVLKEIIEEIISLVPLTINHFRDKERFYDLSEAYHILIGTRVLEAKYAKKKSKTIGPFMDNNNKVTHDPHTMGDMLKTQYKSVQSKPTSEKIVSDKVKDLFEKDSKLKEFDKLRQDNPFLSDRLHFKWAQLIDSIALDWRIKIRDNTTSDEVCMSKYGLYYYSHSGLHLVDLSCKAMYSKLSKQTLTEPKSVQYWETKLNVGQRRIDWRKVFLIPRISTIESYTRSFQYKILNNALFFNKTLFKFGVIESPACSFCGQVDESQIHFFCQCSVTVELWKKLQRWLTSSIVLPDLTLENALLGYMPIISDNGTTAKMVNHILLILREVYMKCIQGKLPHQFFYTMNKIKQIRDIEYRIAKKSDKLTLHFNKWDLLNLQVVNP